VYILVYIVITDILLNITSNILLVILVPKNTDYLFLSGISNYLLIIGFPNNKYP
jgi:hypothetical protein